jgi:hypothetical protein
MNSLIVESGAVSWTVRNCGMPPTGGAFGTSVRKYKSEPPSRVLQITMVSICGSADPGITKVTCEDGMGVVIVYNGDAVDICPVKEPVGVPKTLVQSGGIVVL